MTTVAEVVEETIDHLQGTNRGTLNVLASSVVAGDLTWTFADDLASTIGPGSFLSVDTELVYVRSVTPASKQAVVVRAQRGTTAASHAADALVEVNPRFPRYRILRALEQEIRSWPNSVFRVVNVDLDTASGQHGYSLTGITEIHRVLQIQRAPSSYDSISDAWVPVPFRLLRNADTTAFPAGVGVVLEKAYGDVRDLRVIVAAPFDLSTFTEATTLESCGIPERMHDIPSFGAAYRLMAGREVKRTFGEGQGEPRSADEVPPGFSSSVATYLKRIRNERLSEEAAVLLGQWPYGFR